MYNQIQITYQVPYNNCEWRFQSFPTVKEAQSMIDFYISCGSPAKFVDDNDD
jgi:hypothetical protein